MFKEGKLPDRSCAPADPRAAGRAEDLCAYSSDLESVTDAVEASFLMYEQAFVAKRVAGPGANSNLAVEFGGTGITRHCTGTAQPLCWKCNFNRDGPEPRHTLMLWSKKLAKKVVLKPVCVQRALAK
eukprot:Skav217356  [mRNA]  locus=scaffold4442:80077:82305:+ [translate_table: standard]